MKEVEVPSGPVPTSDEVVETALQSAVAHMINELANHGVHLSTYIVTHAAYAAIEAYQRATQGGVASGLPAAPQVPQWEKMDTAPKDGTRLLVELDHPIWPVQAARWRHLEWRLDNNDWPCNPLRWMPLPVAQVAAVATEEQERPSADATPPLALHDREAMEAAERIERRDRNDFSLDATNAYVAMLFLDARTVARALLQGHDREAVIEADIPTPDPATMRDYIDKLTRFYFENPEWVKLCEEARGYIGAIER